MPPINMIIHIASFHWSLKKQLYHFRKSNQMTQVEIY